MNCLIIDDEPLAHKVILRYCDNLPHLKVVKSCFTALEAITFLSDKQIDLLFLDINMPKLKGLDFLRTIANPPIVIITTAYQEFALESYELNVCDYLLKPFSLERFLKAINRAQDLKKLKEASVRSTQHISGQQQSSSEPSEKSLFIKGDKKIHQVNLNNVLYLESSGSYVKFYLQDEMVMTLERLTNFEAVLPSERFVRIHKSFIVSVKKIEVIEGNSVVINKQRIPIGKVYKYNLDKVLRNK